MVSPKKDPFNLYSFAYCPSFDGMIKYLASVAEPETWTLDENHPYQILRKYIFTTFRQCYIQNKILYSADQRFCCINTGLLTKNGKDILMLFDCNQQDKKEKWHLLSFRNKSERQFMDHFTDIPPIASYTDNYADFYFNPDYSLELNIDHILDDNWERIATQLPQFGKDTTLALINSAVEDTKLRIRRNLRLVVPQFYKDQIMYLVPIRIPVNGNIVTFALAVEKTPMNQYRANTIFTKEDAYAKARILMKPESNWLIE